MFVNAKWTVRLRLRSENHLLNNEHSRIIITTVLLIDYIQIRYKWSSDSDEYCDRVHEFIRIITLSKARLQMWYTENTEFFSSADCWFSVLRLELFQTSGVGEKLKAFVGWKSEEETLLSATVDPRCQQKVRRFEFQGLGISLIATRRFISAFKIGARRITAHFRVTTHI